ncbi:tryptophan transporter [Oceanobacillus caeni]|uniref:Tryptophan transporter n=1 Tax=Oceanobacillus caeni TaxID=405946 RepID=A0ABR5MNN7_9BACI|nr:MULTISPECIES: tryptophan transporter [Bacillaceae]KKE79204.1 tryptophan transporter [Bacilli bacterium VT-13-104]PZD87696.1 tryptophan transporter [Bacilli bacterium]KPH79200.1 tryptophan transporter [Oceanobacillus caeni]MBU8790373.1 tryptophan transporter [Oceanobacillus caeni]MCR1834626.1 tryptophan transporter [Oceanobacillus caeni]
MNIRILITLSLLVGIGTVLHAVVPGFVFGVKPDMLLSMMFLGVFLFPKARYVLLLALVSGVISALTTQAPGGQIANMIDKPLSAFIVLALFVLLQKKVRNAISAPILTFIGTVISGSVFVGVVALFAGLGNGTFLAMFVGAVLPAAAVNTLIMVVIYPVVQSIMKRTKFIAAT